MRSIASEKPTPNRAASGTSSSSAGDTDDWGASSSAKSTSPITPSASSAPSSFSDSFNIAAWGDSLSSSSSRKDRGLDDKKKTIVPQNSRNTEAQEADGGGSEDFDR